MSTTFNHNDFLSLIEKESNRISAPRTEYKLSSNHPRSTIAFKHNYLQNRINFNAEINQFLQSNYKHKLKLHQRLKILKVLNYYSMYNISLKIMNIYNRIDDPEILRDCLISTEKFDLLCEYMDNSTILHNEQLQFMIYSLIWKKNNFNIPEFAKNYMIKYLMSSYNKEKGMMANHFVFFIMSFCEIIHEEAMHIISCHDNFNMNCDVYKFQIKQRNAEFYGFAMLLPHKHEKIKSIYIDAIIQHSDKLQRYKNYETVISLFGLSENCYFNKEYQIGLKILKCGYKIGNGFMLEKFHK